MVCGNHGMSLLRGHEHAGICWIALSHNGQSRKTFAGEALFGDNRLRTSLCEIRRIPAGVIRGDANDADIGGMLPYFCTYGYPGRIAERDVEDQHVRLSGAE